MDPSDKNTTARDSKGEAYHYRLQNTYSTKTVRSRGSEEVRDSPHRRSGLRARLLSRHRHRLLVGLLAATGVQRLGAKEWWYVSEHFEGGGG